MPGVLFKILISIILRQPLPSLMLRKTKCLHLLLHLIDEGCLSPQPQKKTDFTFGSPPKNNTSTGKVSRNHYQGPTVKPGCLKSISSLKKAATSTESTTASTSTCHNKLSITDFVGKEASRPRGVSPPRGSNQGLKTLYFNASLLAQEQDIQLLQTKNGSSKSKVTTLVLPPDHVNPEAASTVFYIYSTVDVWSPSFPNWSQCSKILLQVDIQLLQVYQ